MSCPLQLSHEGKTIIDVTGQECSRGANYARQEFPEPRRAMSTTVAIQGARWERLPVKVSGPVHKDKVMEAARKIHKLRVAAPVKAGQVLLKDLLGEAGVNVLATRSMGRVV